MHEVPVLQAYIRCLIELIAGGSPGHEVTLTPGGPVGDPMERFVPSVQWSRGVNAALHTAAAFVPDGDRLATMEPWWGKTIRRDFIAPWVCHTTLHGDLRFANTLVHKGRPDHVEVFDFGNVHEGHLFFDLAKFECDLLFRVTPSEIHLQDSNVRNWSAEELRGETIGAACTADFRCDKFTDHTLCNRHLKRYDHGGTRATASGNSGAGPVR